MERCRRGINYISTIKEGEKYIEDKEAIKRFFRRIFSLIRFLFQMSFEEREFILFGGINLFL